MKWVPKNRADENDDIALAKHRHDDWKAKGKGKGGEAKGSSAAKPRGGRSSRSHEVSKHPSTGKGDSSRTGKGGSKADGRGGKAGKGGGKSGKGKDGGKSSDDETDAKNQARAAAALVRRPKGPEAIAKQPIDAKGKHCEVRKHSGMGCAHVSMDTLESREMVMKLLERKFGGNKDEPPKMNINGTLCQMRRHTDKATQQEVVTDIFVAWGHKQEKECPLACDEISEVFDQLVEEARKSNMAVVSPSTGPMQHPQFGQVVGMPMTPQSPQMFPGAGGPRPGGMVPPPPVHMPSVGAAAMAPTQMMPAQGQGFFDYQRNAAPYVPCMQMQGQAQTQPQGQQTQLPMYYPQAQPQQQYPQYFTPQAVAYHQQQQMFQMRQMQMQMPVPQPMQQVSAPMTPTTGMPMSPAVGQHVPASPGQGGVVPLTPATAGIGGDLPSTPERPSAPTDGAPKKEYTPTRAPPRIVPIVDPKTGKPLDPVGMDFKPRQDRRPLKIVDPRTKTEISIT